MRELFIGSQGSLLLYIYIVTALPLWRVRQEVARRPCATRGENDNGLAYLGNSPC